MRSDIAAIIAFGLSFCTVVNAAPTFSCFDPPDEGQSNPLGEGMEDVVGSECCEALIDESDIFAGREVVWDPVNCNHGPGESPITEAPLCRAHDTDGCRFCRDSCVGFEGLCITCDEILGGLETSSPTASPSSGLDTEFPETPAPFDIFPETPAPTTAAVVTPAPVTPAAVTPAPVTPAVVTPAPVTAAVAPDTPAPVTAAVAPDTPAPVTPAAPTPVETEEPASDCVCVNTMSAEEQAVLERRSKNMVCDPTCSDGTDLIWNVLNCDYFALGQDCRACSLLCEDMGDGTWEDQDGFPCKPCSAV